jgi:hypothetical protein
MQNYKCTDILQKLMGYWSTFNTAFLGAFWKVLKYSKFFLKSTESTSKLNFEISFLCDIFH